MAYPRADGERACTGISEVTAHLVEAGGKRLRPLLTLPPASTRCAVASGIRGACSLAIRSRISAFTRAMSPSSAPARPRRRFPRLPACPFSLGSRSTGAVTRLGAMRELLRTSGPTVIAFSTALLRGEDINSSFWTSTRASWKARSASCRAGSWSPTATFSARAWCCATTTSPTCCELWPAELSCDAFLDGRLRLWQPQIGYRAATDPVLLAAFVPARPGGRSSTWVAAPERGALPRRPAPGLELHGLEVQPAYAELARRDAVDNRLALTVHDGDLRRPPAELRRLSFDQVIANPPFHPATATGSPDSGRDRAHDDAPLADWIAAGLRRLLLAAGWRSSTAPPGCPRYCRADRRRRVDRGAPRRPAGRATLGAGLGPGAKGPVGAANPLVTLNLA